MTLIPLQAKNRPLSMLVCFALAVQLVGCGTQPTTRPGATTPATGLEGQALDAVEAGDARSAATLYERLAEQAQGPTRADYLLAAARQRLALNELAVAGQRLDRAAVDASPAQRVTLLLLQAELALRLAQPELTLARLAELPTPLPAAVQPEALLLRGQALFALERLPQAVTALVQRERWLTRPEDILANQRLLWDGLSHAPLDEAQPSAADSVLAGWLALQPAALAARANPYGLPRDLADWRSRYPGHPAARMLLDDLLLSYQLMTNYPGQLALVLPLSGRQKLAAEAVRDGMMAALMASDSEARPRLRIYDSGQLGATRAYLQAEQEGADFIVGPLLKTAVDEVLSVAGQVPTLTLNFAAPELPGPANLFQFSLAPEDEATTVAHRAIAEGQTRAVALVANNDWGIRVLTSFRNEFEALGGQLLGFKGYDLQGQDFSGAITALLELDQSNQRRRRLSANLGKPLEFQPRRRQDVDMILLAAEAQAARLLRPQLRFHYAQDLPTYATSDVYSPGDRGNNNDLSGIRFPDLPWLVEPDAAGTNLRSMIEAYWPQSGPRLIRLYAMGHDAYRLIPLLYNRGEEQALRMDGLSGRLSMDAAGRIHRELAFAQFRAGRLVPFQSLSEADDLESTTGEP